MCGRHFDTDNFGFYRPKKSVYRPEGGKAHPCWREFYRPKNGFYRPGFGIYRPWGDKRKFWGDKCEANRGGGLWWWGDKMEKWGDKLGSDGVDERVNREQGTADHDADKAGHNNHEDRLDHGGDVIDLFV